LRQRCSRLSLPRQEAMNITKMEANWNAWGIQDPMWAILSDPDKKGNKWDEAEFFQSGIREIDDLLGKVTALGIALVPEAAMDFGCGLGRLSQALANHFARVDGYDVSPSMIAKAQALNRAPTKVFFHHNPKTDLSHVEGQRYDFIYSSLVLQHIPTRFQRLYLAEFTRLLKPGGSAVLQTVEAAGWRSLLPNSLVEFYRQLKYRGRPIIPMYGIRPSTVCAILAKGRCAVRQIERGPMDTPRFDSRTYYAVKTKAASSVAR
jgi:2-polyprenyl-3-methyl-5-hydroxy-6-metoxy-1,4-benzoquinol methylase